MSSIEIVVAYHPKSKLCQDIARSIHSHYCRSITAPVLYSTIGIPVYYETNPERLNRPRIESTASQRFIVLLVDEAMAGAPCWQDAISNIQINSQEAEGGLTIYVPIIYARRAERLFSRLQAEVLLGASDDEQVRATLATLTKAIAQHVLRDTTKKDVFISYAHTDGTELATNIRNGLCQRQSTVIPFVDRIDMRSGGIFEKEIDERIKRSLFLVVLTDSYSSRNWCAKELLAAKEAGVPMLIVDAICERSDRLLPYVGNAPVLRWHDGEAKMDEITEQVTYELIRSKYRTDELEKAKTQSRNCNCVTIFTSHPEAHTLFGLEPGTTVLYPEPPITSAEQRLIHKLYPELALKSFAQFVSCDMGGHDGKGKLIGISASLPLQMQELGIGKEHYVEALVDLVRHLHLANYVTSYGGDWRRGGLTEAIAGVADAHSTSESDLVLVNYLSDAYQEKSDGSEEWSHVPHVNIHHVPSVQVDGMKIASHDESNIEYSVWQALSLSKMRAEMTKGISARVLIGGKQDHGLPRGYPGVLEEFFLSASTKQPIYIVGGFGGCAKSIMDALFGKAKLRDFAPNMYDLAFAQRYTQAASQAGLPPLDPKAMETIIEGQGYTVLNNGLSDEENAALATAKSSTEIAQLVLKGLFLSLGR